MQTNSSRQLHIKNNSTYSPLREASRNGEWQWLLDQRESAPQAYIWNGETRIRMLGLIIWERPREVFRSMAVETLPYEPNLAHQLLVKTGVTDQQSRQLIAIVNDVSIDVLAQAMTIDLLVKFNQRAASPAIRDFIKRHKLVARDRHDKNHERVTYRRLKIDTGDVLVWQRWLDEAK